ncbi:MAG: uroporphyrinogen decarboxylase [Candidatus Omnitrophica bacterium]|nr:uroporphyrinogen decarboxylase [Candidatus Omnitrophota bacterium]
MIVKNDPILLRALRGEHTERTPLWLMRQAGRSDPEYRAYRERNPWPLEQLFRDVDAAVEISLLPKRAGVDGIIFFQDILTPLAPMGAPFVFRPGPILEHPIRDAQAIHALHEYDPAIEMPFIAGTLRTLRKTLTSEVPLLGFAGAPLTLLFFLIEGGSPGRGENARKFLQESPALAQELLEKLTRMTIDYLEYQIESGAEVIQLFESIADLPTDEEYISFALPSQKEIFQRLKGRLPLILFAKGKTQMCELAASGADAISIHSHCSIQDARTILGDQFTIQGNLNNRLFAEGPLDQVETAVRACITSGKSQGHILNLDHGLLAETPWERVQWLVELVRSIPHSRNDPPGEAARH